MLVHDSYMSIKFFPTVVAIPHGYIIIQLFSKLVSYLYSLGTYTFFLGKILEMEFLIESYAHLKC